MNAADPTGLNARVVALRDLSESALCAVDGLEVHGSIDHRDAFFSAAEKSEGKRLCACVSRGFGPDHGGGLVIDPAWRPDTLPLLESP